MPSGSSGTIASVTVSQPTSRAWPASMSEFVSGISPRPRGSQWADLVARGHDRHPRPATNRELREAGRTRRGDVHRPQPMALGQQELGRADVLADRADVLIGRRGRLQLGLGAVEMYVLAHDDGVEAVGQGSPVSTVAKSSGSSSSGVWVWRPPWGARARQSRPWPRRRSPETSAVPTLLRPSPGRSRPRARALRGHTRRASGRRTDLEPGGQRLRRRPIADERVSRRASPRPRCRRRGRSPVRRRRRSRRRP